MDWTDGYVADTQYTAGFYREMAPVFMTFAGAMTGHRMPDEGQPFAYCELGCGQGVGTAILAAANPDARFYGIDFNPGQIDNAQRLARTAGVENVSFIEASFAELLGEKGSDLPAFDYITLHGVYSWITAESRAAVVRFIERKLKPGGAVYVSYNTMPGWAAMAPARRLMSEVAARRTGRSDAKAVAGLDELDRLKAAGSRYFAANPSVETRLTKARSLDKTYLAHEYLNANWHPLYVTDTFAEMAAAKLGYIGSATLVENLDTVFLPQALREAAAPHGDAAFTELLKDFHSNKQFRRDLFVRGANKSSFPETIERLSAFRFTLSVPVDALKLSFDTIMGPINGNQNIYEPLAKALGGASLSFGQLLQLPELKITPSDLLQSLCLLTYSNQAMPLRETTPTQRNQAHRFNATILQSARRGRPLPFLVVPGSGLGIAIAVSHLFVLCAMAEGLRGVDALVPRVTAMLAQNNIGLTKDGKALVEPEAVAEEARRQIAEMIEKQFPIWRRMEILPDSVLG